MRNNDSTDGINMVNEKNCDRFLITPLKKDIHIYMAGSLIYAHIARSGVASFGHFPVIIMFCKTPFDYKLRNVVFIDVYKLYWDQAWDIFAFL